jgi:hypothetical protein
MGRGGDGKHSVGLFNEETRAEMSLIDGREGSGTMNRGTEVKAFEVSISKAFGEEGEMLEVVATDREVIAGRFR